ncbi:ACP phosphodiesterase [Vibrio marisflavi]|uniref:Acyl carrier protein phosphodiesterase n=1 Tax=Vibrio marisflavi CECT 7928 TaxID=634439 RepID=A0ABN8E1U8_9VIBR|nr:ACP phosphodiesterase [Vibrio marisflavi]CAH0536919.1 Acyl carrier protein phosphodiesterase [Vibrio marisflavi CECT 7928]
MNFLAHLHIAEHCGSSLLGNFLGDFVKGNPAKHFRQQSILKGIKLHRFVDSYVDSHEIVKNAKLLFPTPLIRFSPIALDVFWDFCLASNWQNYHKISLPQFCEQAKAQFFDLSDSNIPERARQTAHLMWTNRWLESYQYLENVEYVLDRISQRTPRIKPLSNCFTTILQHEQKLTSMFGELYPQVLSSAKQNFRQI